MKKKEPRGLRYPQEKNVYFSSVAIATSTFKLKNKAQEMKSGVKQEVSQQLSHFPQNKQAVSCVPVTLHWIKF